MISFISFLANWIYLAKREVIETVHEHFMYKLPQSLRRFYGLLRI
jgi:hypothetical protein